jgi:hypothetical protein
MSLLLILKVIVFGWTQVQSRARKVLRERRERKVLRELKVLRVLKVRKAYKVL